MHDLSRRLDPRHEKVKVFLSHAKSDGREITEQIRTNFRSEARLDDFFDAADIPDGTRFAEFVATTAGSSHALLAVQTDSYASREWCRLEVLEAKKHEVPIVVLSATETGEARAFPYLGNVPVIRWHGMETLPRIAAAVLREVLKTRFFPQRARGLAMTYGLSSSHVMPFAPELMTILSRLDGGSVGEALLYPDPPLGTVELGLLEQAAPGIVPVTPSQLVSR